MRSQRFALAGAFALLAIGACGRSSGREARPEQSSSRAAASDTSRATADSEFFSGLSRIEVSTLPAELTLVCDTVAAILDAAIGGRSTRRDGAFADSFKGERRVGCRMTRVGSPKAAGTTELGPTVESALGRRRWAQDLRYTADGPDASDFGMRLRDVLCLISERHPGADDADTTSAKAPPSSDVGVLVECARDVPSNVDAGVPDSVWRIAAALRMDSAYAIDLRLQYPPYLDGDFDGDGVADAAVLVTERRTGKLGVAFVLRGPRRVIVVGAGKAPTHGSDDFSWMNRWDVFPRLATVHLTIPDRPSVPLRADAVWLASGDTTSGFLVWTSGDFLWDARRR